MVPAGSSSDTGTLLPPLLTGPQGRGMHLSNCWMPTAPHCTALTLHFKLRATPESAPGAFLDHVPSAARRIISSEPRNAKVSLGLRGPVLTLT